jgi:tetratricopeptide (TPR) repeat protein
MAEDRNASEGGGESFGAGADPAAMALALGSASQARADHFLEVQTALASDQRHHLHAQMLPTISEKWLGVFLRAATACVGVGVATGLSLLIWQAAHSDGLRVESFSVPPDLAARGMTGEVVATRVIDRLSELQTQTNTQRPARSYTNTWGSKAIKLEIPETGISLAELDSWLRDKVGHETSLTGEVVRTAAGVTLTARAGEDGAVSVSGAEADMDALTRRLAEEIYRITQPYRYAAWLYRHENRIADAVPIFKDLSLNGSPDDRLWSYNMWAQTAGILAGDTEVAIKLYRDGIAADPEATGIYGNLAGNEANMGHWEESVRLLREWRTRLTDGKQRYVAADQIAVAAHRGQADLDFRMGAFHDAALVHEEMRRTGVPGYPLAAILGRLIGSHAGEHDLAAARAALADFPPGPTVRSNALQIALLGEDWNTALGFGEAMAAYLRANPNDRHFALVAHGPSLALAQAHLGNFAAAETSIAPTPADCYPCLIARAQIAELQGQRARAEYWFTRATAAGPSLPFAFEAEGRALLERGQPDAAIARFTIANQKSPHFADPIEGVGEALMAKNQSHLALAKFAEAEKHAPNWGRLHLKWGEALAYAGEKDEARAQFARAAALDLTPSEKAELQKFSAKPL